MSDSLVKRLRDPFYTPSLKSHTEAADRIEKLEAALKPFAKWADAYDPDEGDDHLEAWDHAPTIGMLRAARKALEKKDD